MSDGREPVRRDGGAGDVDEVENVRRLMQGFRDRFGAAPRRVGWWARRRIAPRRPDWYEVGDGDALDELWAGRGLLKEFYDTAAITLGHLVQANRALFEWGEGDYPAVVVFAEEFRRTPDPAGLAAAARACGAAKHADPADLPPAWREPGRMLAAERDHLCDVPVPAVVGGGGPYVLSAIFVPRSSLPGGVLTTPLLPLLVRPRPPRVPLVLPHRYWPPDFKTWWAGEE